MTKFLRYIFWSVVYVFRPKAVTFDAYMLRGMRTMFPWKRFKPHVWYNEDGRQWEVYLTDESDYTEYRTLSVVCHVGMDTGDIVGFTIPCEVLTKRRET